MNEHYLEWFFLREHIGDWIEHQFPTEKDVYIFREKQYDIQRMKARYIELTKLLLKDYEL